MRLFSIPLLTTVGAQAATKWFMAFVIEAGGFVHMVAWPPEVLVAVPPEVDSKTLLAGWHYNLVGKDIDREAARAYGIRVCPFHKVGPSLGIEFGIRVVPLERLCYPLIATMSEC
jgi:hypothetical protein